MADAGKQMLESSTSVSEVEDRLREFLPAVGLEGCAIEATMSSFTVSYWKPGGPAPITTVRDISVSEPRLKRLAGTVSPLERAFGASRPSCSEMVIRSRRGFRLTFR